MVVNHQQDTSLLDAFVLLYPFSLGDKESYGILDSFATAFIPHLSDNFVEVFQEFWWKGYTTPSDFSQIRGSPVEDMLLFKPKKLYNSDVRVKSFKYQRDNMRFKTKLILKKNNVPS